MMCRVKSRPIDILNSLPFGDRLNTANPDLTCITYCYFPENANSAYLLRYKFETVLALIKK